MYDCHIVITLVSSSMMYNKLANHNRVVIILVGSCYVFFRRKFVWRKNVNGVPLVVQCGRGNKTSMEPNTFLNSASDEDDGDFFLYFLNVFFRKRKNFHLLFPCDISSFSQRKQAQPSLHTSENRQLDKN